MDWLAVLLPPGVSPLAFAGFCLLSFFTSALTVVAGIGGGIALLTVLISFLPPAVVLPVHGLVQIGSNAGRAVMFRGHLLTEVLAWFGAGAVLGAALAGRVFVALPTTLIEVLIGLFVLYSVWGPKSRRRSLPPRGFLPLGAFSTFASVFVGGTGPLVASFLPPERLGRHRMVATHAGCMTLQHGCKALAFGFIGFHYPPWLPLIAAMIACGLLGTAFGRPLLGRLPEKTFATLFRAVLTLLAARLLVSALLGG